MHFRTNSIRPMRSRSATVMKLAAGVGVVGLVVAVRAYGEPILAREMVVPDALTIFDATMDKVAMGFVDRARFDPAWRESLADTRAKLAVPVTVGALEDATNLLLDRLHSSHTEFLSNADQEYWALSSVFSRSIDGAPVRQIGAWFKRIDGTWFVSSVFENSPAAAAGLLAGDEIVAVDGAPLRPVASFADASASVDVEYRRDAGASTAHLAIRPKLMSVQRALLDGMAGSQKVIEAKGRRIGYVHLWIGTHPDFQTALAHAADTFETTADAMILDLRDGFGGAGPAYVTPFFDHDDTGKPIRQRYTKPLVVLINHGTRSGKEWVAELLKAHGRATLIGTRTAGYFRAGMRFDIAPGRFLLYLAVQSSDTPPRRPRTDAERQKVADDWVDPPALEGVGVSPDITVESPLPYCAGADPQLQAAIAQLTR